MRRWLLPEAIEDILPNEADRIERLRRAVLDEFRLHGYEFVMPPMLEYLDSLLTGSGRDMDLRTFKLVDQLSGRAMGVRADITPQVARIDAHLLNRSGVARLCYAGTVLHTHPAGLNATREPFQVGAELYGHAGIEADAEIIRLLARTIEIAGVTTSRIDLGHVGIFRALVGSAGLSEEQKQELFLLLQTKDVPALKELVADLPEAIRSGLLGLTECYGDAGTLARAQKLFSDNAEICAALSDLEKLSGLLTDFPVNFDLSDLRGYHYHNGVVFAAYCDRRPGAIAQGGRYDKIGQEFGRARAATGFSADIRVLVDAGVAPYPPLAILAPWGAGADLRKVIAELRATGEIVIEALPGHEGCWNETGCDRQLVLRNAQWEIEPIQL